MAFDYQRQSSAQPGVEAPKSPSAFLIQCRIPSIRAEGLAGLFHDKLTARVFPDDAFEAPKLRLSTFLFDFLAKIMVIGLKLLFQFFYFQKGIG